MLQEREFHTKAGLLSGVINEWVDAKGILRSCMFDRLIKIEFHGKTYIPKYDSTDFRSRYRDAVTFYRSGELKSIYLENQQEIDTPAGNVKAEMVTFYASGCLWRVFPVYGQISGFWSEKEEEELLSTNNVAVGGQIIEAKISCFTFYETGALKSITLWPGENIDVNTPAGRIRVRYGISFYESGCVESVEPDIPTVITYDGCDFISYDNHPIGVHGEKNSLSFYEDGRLRTLKTTVTSVILSGDNGKISIAPESRVSLIDMEKTDIVPVGLEFGNKIIRITDSDGVVQEFEWERYSMKTEQMVQNLYTSVECAVCSECSKCGHSQ